MTNRPRLEADAEGHGCGPQLVESAARSTIGPMQ